MKILREGRTKKRYIYIGIVFLSIVFISIFPVKENRSTPFNLDMEADSIIRQLSDEGLVQQLMFYNGQAPLSEENLMRTGGVISNTYNLDFLHLTYQRKLLPLLCVDGRKKASVLDSIIPPRSYHLQSFRDNTLLSEYFQGFLSYLQKKKVDVYFADDTQLRIFRQQLKRNSTQNVIIGAKTDEVTRQPIMWLRDTALLIPSNKQQFVLRELDGEPSAELAFKLWLAGADAFVVGENYQLWHNAILENIEKGSIQRKEIVKRVRKLIQLKKSMQSSPTAFDEIKFTKIQDEIRRKSLTLLNNPKHRLPLPVRDTIFLLGTEQLPAFVQQTNEYVFASKPVTESNTLSGKRVVLCITQRASKKRLEEIEKIGQANELTIVNFGIAEQAGSFTQNSALLQTYGTHENDQRLAAQALFGGRDITGTFPKKLKEQYKIQVQQKQLWASRISLPLPSDVNINETKIDNIVQQAIESRAFPGCQVFALHKGKTVFQKSYGYHTYDRKHPVQNSDLYDLASVSKIAGTTMALMHLYANDKVELMQPLSHYFDIGHSPYISNNLKQRNVLNTKIFELLIHRSGIRPYTPIYNYFFYKRVIGRKLDQQKDKYVPPALSSLSANVSGKIESNLTPATPKHITAFDYYYKGEKDSTTLQQPISKDMFFKRAYYDTLVMETILQRVYKRKRYRYSDINFVLLQMLSDSISKQPMDQLLYQTYYRPLGLKRLLYRPLEKYNRTEIIPTEYDTLWRNTLVHGTVHDPTAALWGGVSGNAGLFSNAKDLAVLGQMLLQKGNYGEQKLIEPHVVEFFTRPQSIGKRGLGFDTALRTTLVGNKTHNKAFGHTGFTGTCIWVDPVNELVYVFLSNRVYPDQENKTLIYMKVRENIQNALYEGIGK